MARANALQLSVPGPGAGATAPSSAPAGDTAAAVQWVLRLAAQASDVHRVAMLRGSGSTGPGGDED
eukprot:1379265-Lingulodinium_polyedra.AAC.1